MKRDIQGHEVSKFTDIGPSQSAVMTNDVTLASNVLQISAETLTVAAGAAGTTGIAYLDKAPVFDAYGTRIGSLGATSFAFVTGTLLTTEVAYDSSLTDTEMLASLSHAGMFAIDYVMGRIYYNKATAATSDTCNYKTRQLNVEITATAPISIGSVSLVDAKAEDSAHTTGDKGIQALGVRNNTLGTLADTDGDYAPFQMNASGALYTQTTPGSVGVYVEDAPHTTGDYGMQTFAVRKDVAGSFGDTDGDYVPLQVDSDGALRITGTVSAATEYAEDTAHTTGDKGIQMLSVQMAANAALADDGDYAPIQVSQDGYVKTTMNAIRDAAVAIGSGAMDSGTQRVNLASDDPAVVSLATMDDWDESDRAKVNPIVGQAGIAANAGAMDALTTRVTLATDDTHMGAVGAAADPDGVVHGQLRSIAENTDALPAALGVAASAASLPVVVASDDAHFGAVGSGPDSAGGIHEQLSYLCAAVDDIEGKEIYKAVATGSGAISLSSSASSVWELDSVTIHFDVAPTTSEDLTITLDSTDGAAYDTKLLTLDPSTADIGDITFTPNKPLLLASGDEINVSFTNTDGNTYGVRIVGKKLS